MKNLKRPMQRGVEMDRASRKTGLNVQISSLLLYSAVVGLFTSIEVAD